MRGRVERSERGGVMWLRIVTNKGNLRLVNLDNVAEIKPNPYGGTDFAYIDDTSATYDIEMEKVETAMDELLNVGQERKMNGDD
jgi:hypothetical protein